MAEITIRGANLGDLEPLVRFNQGIARETEDRELDEHVLREGIRSLLEDRSLGFYSVAVWEQRVVACLMITREWSDWRNGVFWWIQSVYVDAEFRRQGIYRRLYEFVKELAAGENVCGFRLYVERDNTVAQQTYASMGMSETVYRMYEEATTRS